MASNLTDRLRDHYEHPRNVGSLPVKDRGVITVTVRATECGDLMRLQARVDPVSGVIRETRFKVFGCGAAIASASFTTDWLRSRTVEQASRFEPALVIAGLGLSSEQAHSARLAGDAVGALVREHRSRGPRSAEL